MVFPDDTAGFAFDRDGLRDAWPSLHRGDLEARPDAVAELDAWALFHAGRFVEAAAAGRAAGGSGETAADRALLARAHYVETREAVRLGLCCEVAGRASARARARPDDASAHHLLGVALARYAQGTNIGRALEQGLLARIREALEATIALAPRHADAHVALGTFHAEVVDKLGALIGRTQGASKDRGLAMFRTALKLDPESALARNAYAQGLMMLEGEPCLERATRLHEAAAATVPRDASERLEVEIARRLLEE